MDSQTQTLNLPIRAMAIETTIPKGPAVDFRRLVADGIIHSQNLGANILGDEALMVTELRDSDDGLSTIARQTVTILEVGGVDVIQKALRHAFVGGVENVLGDIEAAAESLRVSDNIAAARAMMDLADKLRERTIDERFKLTLNVVEK